MVSLHNLLLITEWDLEKKKKRALNNCKKGDCVRILYYDVFFGEIFVCIWHLVDIATLKRSEWNGIFIVIL